MPCRIPLPALSVSASPTPPALLPPPPGSSRCKRRVRAEVRGERATYTNVDGSGCCWPTAMVCGACPTTGTVTPKHPPTRRMFRPTSSALKLPHRYHPPSLLPSIFFLPLSPPLSLLSSSPPSLLPHLITIQATQSHFHVPARDKNNSDNDTILDFNVYTTAHSRRHGTGVFRIQFRIPKLLCL